MLSQDTATDGDALHLAGTLAARICHDLAGSLGALCGTLEMAGDDPEALSLSLDIAREMAARLRLIRAAWGEGAETPQLASLAQGLPHANRIALVTEDAALDAPARRLAACLLIEAASGLPRGGEIKLTGTAAAFSIDIAGVRAAWPDYAEPAMPRTADAAVARALAARLGFRMETVGTRRNVRK